MLPGLEPIPVQSDRRAMEATQGVSIRTVLLISHPLRSILVNGVFDSIQRA